MTYATLANASSADKHNIDRIARTGVLAILIGFGGFLLWAFFAPLSEGIVASGSIVVDGKRKTIQHLEGGIVRTIRVREGDAVAAGDILVELDQTQGQAKFDLLQTRYYTHLSKQDRLRAEREGQAEITYSEDLLRHQEEVKVRELMSVQNNLFQARKAQLDGQISILENRIEQLGRQAQGLKAELEARQDEITYIDDELNRVEALHARGLIGLPKLLAQKKSRSQAIGAIGKTEAGIAGIEVDTGKARLEILQLEKERQQENAQSTLETQEQLFEVQEQLASIGDILERTLIRAPQSGHVLGLTVWTVGGVVPPGQSLMEIVPDDQRLIVEARVRPTDIDNVHAGMPARARFVALKSRTTPILNGTVTDVSADVMMDETSRESFYVARIEISADEIARIEDDTVVPGMPVEVLVEAGHRTVIEYLTDPIMDVVRRSLKEE